MTLEIAQVIVATFEAYALAGRGIRAAVPATRRGPDGSGVAGAPWTLRLLILPGVAALWPLFAWRWMTGAPEPIERNPHRAKAGAR